MHITWHGNYTIKIQVDEKVLVIDPYSPETGLGSFRGKADVVALTNPTDPTMSYVSGIQGEPALLNMPGEYEVGGFALYAVAWRGEDGEERSIQRWNIEGLTLLHVGALPRDLTDTELQELEKTGIDVLFVPIGGGNSLTTDQAMKLVTTIEPRVIIPIHYAIPGLKEKLTSLEQFTKQMGIGTVTPEKKLILKASKLPTDQTTTTILSPQ